MTTRQRKRCFGCGIFFSSLSRHYTKSSCEEGGSKKPRPSPNVHDGGDNLPNDLTSCNSSDSTNLDDPCDDRTGALDNIEELDLNETFIAGCNSAAPPSSTRSPSTICPHWSRRPLPRLFLASHLAKLLLYHLISRKPGFVLPIMIVP